MYQSPPSNQRSSLIKGSLVGLLLLVLVFASPAFAQTGDDSCELSVSSLAISNIATSTADYEIDLSYTDAPVLEVTVLIGGQAFTQALSTASGSENLAISGAPLSGTVEVFFTGSQGLAQKSQSVNVSTPTTPINCGPGDIGGTLFQDFDANGTRDPAFEPSIAFGLSFVNAYDASNTVVGSSIVGSNGVYAISGLDLSQAYRLELETPSGSALGIGNAGPGSASNVIFINGATCDADFAIQDPSELCLTDGTLVTPCYVNGNPLIDGAAADTEAFLGWASTNRGNTALPDQILPASALGSVWGVAADSRTRTVYTSAVLKRHSGFGPEGPGAIYEIDASGAFSASSWVVLSNPGVDPRDETDPANSIGGDLDGLSQDQDAFGLIGKIGIGDIDLSADGSTLYAINLNTRSLVLVDTATASEGDSIPIPAPSGVAAADNRPWALEVYRGEVFVGTVDALNLTAHVLKLEGNSFVEFAGPFDLTYPRTDAFRPNSGDIDWLPWLDTFATTSTAIEAFDGADENSVYPQPILADIEFDSADGSLILGLMDRRGLQTGALNLAPDGQTLLQTVSAGDILRACPNGSGGFTLENAGLCNGTGSGTVAGDGPGGGEFYDQDFFDRHKETILGGLAHLPGSGEVAANIFNPFDFRSGGTAFFDNTTGADNGRYQLYGTDQAGTFAKGVGLGDLEFFCDEAPPVVVGNRLWFDFDGDGVQDPGESGVAGVSITLDDGNGGTVVTQTLADDPATPADEAGNFYFSSVGNAAGVLVPEASFTLSVDLMDADFGSVVQITTGAAGTNDEHDNDADAAGQISFISPSAGENDFSFDIGVQGLGIGDFVWADENRDGIQDPSEPAIPGILVSLYDENDVLLQTTRTDSNGFYLFNGLDPLTAYQVVLGRNEEGGDDQFENGLLLDVLELTTQNALTSDDLDSDAAVAVSGPFAGLPVINLITGTEVTLDLDYDFGFRCGNGGSEITVIEGSSTTVTGDVAAGSASGEVTDRGDAQSGPVSNTEGAPDGISAEIGSGSNFIVVMLEDEIPAGSTYTIHAAVRGGGPATVSISEAPDGTASPASNATVPPAGYTANGTENITGSTVTMIDVVAATDTKFLFLTRGSGDILIDAVTYDVTVGSEDPTITCSDEIVAFDFGDLPQGGASDFPTAGAEMDDRPRHQLGSGLILGESVDAEEDGQPSTFATGDGADEDGFVNLPVFVPGETYTIPFEVIVPSEVANAALNAWIDFNMNGVLEAGEQVADDLAVIDGTNALTITVPDDAVQGTSYARFRLSSDANVEVSGDASDGEVEDYLITVAPPMGAIGNYVWLDENSDGLQDVGEPGLANIKVDLFDADGTLITSTFTDANGGYLFDELPAGTFSVAVDEATLPAGYTQTATLTNPGSDFGNQDQGGNGYSVTIAAGETNLTGDFGYNANPSADVDGGENLAALGDQVWIDADQDGVRDPNEVGVSGVTLTLTGAGPDGIFGNGDDVTASATTNASGSYLFDGLTPGAFMVEVDATNFEAGGPLEGFTQFGDPDHFAGLAGEAPVGTAGDNKSTLAIILGPGDVFLNADFGYDSDLLGSIGNTVWLDENTSGGDQTTQGAEAGIAGVTVSLALDADGDGFYDAGTDLFIATDITDEMGAYLFDGLALDADYLVVVTDTDHVLDGLSQTYDQDGPLDGISATSLSVAVPEDLDQDFSYSPQTLLGSIGDTVWADLDNSGGDQATQGVEPGIANLTVTLTSAGLDGEIGTADDLTVATTSTDANGQYLFSGLPLGQYKVMVDTADADFPVGDLDPASSYEPSDLTVGGVAGDDMSIVTIDAMNLNDRDQDFSYPPANNPTLGSIGDLVSLDSTGPGIAGNGVQALDGTEPGIAGVEVKLFTDGDDNTLGTADDVTIGFTTTDENGEYLFTDLPLGETYRVMITPPAGFTIDSDTAAGEGDPLGAGDGMTDVTLPALGLATADTANPRDLDFSLDSAAPLYSLGDTIWFDADSSGGDQATQGAEPGIEGVLVELRDRNGTLIATTTTDLNGTYLFNNLPDGDYTVSVVTASLPSNVSPVSTYESDLAGTGSTVMVSIDGADDLDQDFSYPPLGGIGDTVFFDTNRNGQPDLGEGIGGVTVKLTDTNGTPTDLSDDTVATTTTDSQGRYFFGGLTAGDYNVMVDPDDENALITASVNSVDPDDLGPDQDEQSDLTLGLGETNLEQDFGYQADPNNNGSIGNLVWLDQNADGLFDGANGPDGDAATADDNESGIAGVTLDLYYDTDGNGEIGPGEPKLGTETTDSNGAYLFEALPLGDYVVKVTDTDGLLSGYWHSLGGQDATTNGGNDAVDSSKSDEFAVTIDSGTPDNLNVDFGYYFEPAAVGNFVWNDLDNDGIQDIDEPGIEGATLTLNVTYPNGDMVTVVTQTDANGFYSFPNLLLDEDHNMGMSAGNPIYNIAVEAPEGFVLTESNNVIAGGGNDLNDADLSGVEAKPVQGLTDVDAANLLDGADEPAVASYDFAVRVAPKSADFADFLVDNAELFNLDDNTTNGVLTSGVPVIDPLTGVINANVIDVNGDDAAIGTLAGNPDGDIYSNLLEFALCFDPGTGAKVFPDGTPNEGFHLEMGAATLDAKFTRPSDAAGLTYVIQSSTDGQIWSDEVTIAGNSLDGTTSSPGSLNGTEEICFEDVFGTIGDEGLLRLQVSAGADASATSSLTGVIGFQKATILDFCQSYSEPLMETCVFTGAIDLSDTDGDEIISLSDSVGTGTLASVLEADLTYYLEVISGENEGHRFDIASFTDNSLTLEVDNDLFGPGAPHNTRLDFPSDLAGDSVVIRAHQTLGDLFLSDDPDTIETDGFAVGSNVNNAATLLLLNRTSGELETLFLTSLGWINSQGSVLSDDVILPPCEGIFVHNLEGEDSFMIMQFGEVRTNAAACPMQEGFNLIGAAHAVVDQSIDSNDTNSRDMNSTAGRDFVGSGSRARADQVLVWVDDENDGSEQPHLCYDLIFYLNVGNFDRWALGGDNTATDLSDNPLFNSTRSYMHFVYENPATTGADDKPLYTIPSPISSN